MANGNGCVIVCIVHDAIYASETATIAADLEGGA